MKLVRLFALVVLSIGLVACATKPVAPRVPVSYTGTDLIYPAVFKAVAEVISPSVNFESAQIYTNSFVTETFTFQDVMSARRAKLAIALANGVISYQLQDQELQDSRTKVWRTNTAYIGFNPDRDLYVKLDNVIRTVLAGGEPYEEAKSAALQSGYFLKAVAKPMTQISRDEFINKELKDRVLSFPVEVTEVKEEAKQIDGQDYRFAVKASYKFVSGAGDLAAMTNLLSGLSFTLRTNDSTVISFSRGTQTTLTGKIVSVNDAAGGFFFFELVTP